MISSVFELSLFCLTQPFGLVEPGASEPQTTCCRRLGMFPDFILNFTNKMFLL